MGEPMSKIYRVGRICAPLAAAALIVSCSLPVTVEKIEREQQNFEGIDYFLPKGIVDLTIKSNSTVDKDGKPTGNLAVSLSIDAVKYLPDPFYHYNVNINHDSFYDDDISVAVDEKGLLKSVNSITTDRTADIIQKIAEAPTQILKVTFLPEKPRVTKFDIKFSIDPDSAVDRARLNEHLANIDPRIQFRAQPIVSIPSGRSKQHPDCGIHICFRTAMPYALELFTAEGSDVVVVARQIAILPNRHVVGQIPITRAPFVKKDFKLAFTNGMLTSVSLNNPSEVLGFVQIPITVAKAIVSIPSAMLQFKTTQITADNNLLAAQQKNLDLQKQIIDTQQKLLAAQAAAGS